ncbi:hypothetical protein BY996DRAFT_6485535 [Phakopsora pachyrhizi]|nr:hypothetical protein BY996DRAFT_6485535 [Phakopsora pachyrhizi]
MRISSEEFSDRLRVKVFLINPAFDYDCINLPDSIGHTSSPILNSHINQSPSLSKFPSNPLPEETQSLETTEDATTTTPSESEKVLVHLFQHTCLSTPSESDCVLDTDSIRFRVTVKKQM